MNLGTCRRLASIPETGNWFRAVELVHLATPINTAHTRLYRSRFSAGQDATPPYETLYLAETPQVALFEIGAMAGDPLTIGSILSAPGSFGIVHVKVVL